jgi:hypothetical protein
MLQRAQERDEKLCAWLSKVHAAMGRGLVRMGVRTTVGWVGLLFIAAALAFAIYEGTVFIIVGPPRGRFAGLLEPWIYLAAYIFYFVVVCFAIIYALARRRVRKQRPGWKQLTILGKVLNAILIAASIAFFIAPFAWIAWRVMTR